MKFGNRAFCNPIATGSCSSGEIQTLFDWHLLFPLSKADLDTQIRSNHSFKVGYVTVLIA